MQDYSIEGRKYKEFTIAIVNRSLGMTEDMGALDAAIWDLYKNSNGSADAITDQMIRDAISEFSRTPEANLEHA